MRRLMLSQAKEYIANGFEVLAIVGANRSLNCGEDTTKMRKYRVKIFS